MTRLCTKKILRNIPKHNTHTHPNYINMSKFSKVARNWKSIYKNKLYFYSLAMNSWKVKYKIPLAMAYKNVRHLEINLKKDTRDLYTENYETLLRRVKENLNKGKYVTYSWIGRLKIVKMSIFSEVI